MAWTLIAKASQGTAGGGGPTVYGGFIPNPPTVLQFGLREVSRGLVF